MDLLGIAQRGYDHLAPNFWMGVTEDLSDSAERWLRDQVCPVAEQLGRTKEFRSHATWSLRCLARGADSKERKLVEDVDDALVEAARATFKAAKKLGLLKGILRVGDHLHAGGRQKTIRELMQPQPDITGLESIEWLTSRPWFDLVDGGEYFSGDRGLFLETSCVECSYEFLRRYEPRVPLGDFITRCMLARIEFFHGKIADAFNHCQTSWPSGTSAEGPDRLMVAKFALDKAVRRLKNACHRGEEPHLRDACATMVQVHAAYSANPQLEWLGIAARSLEVHAQYVRMAVRPPVDTPVELVTLGAGVQTRNRSIRLCRQDVLQGIAGALARVENLYRRPAEAEDLIESLRQERRLVLVDVRPRQAYWDGEAIICDWDKLNVLWDFLWRLADRGRRGLPYHLEEFTMPGEKPSRSLAHRRSHLKQQIPTALDDLIAPVSPGGYRLKLPEDQVALLQLNSCDDLVEVGLDGNPSA